MNSFGRLLRFHLFGESHGAGVGCVVDGLPPGMPIDVGRIQAALDRRRPGQSSMTTARQEPDQVEIRSGAHRGRATGAPVALWIANADARSKHYDNIRRVPRPGHADFTGHVRGRGWGDPRGGGHFSGRLTAPLVAAGALAAELLEAHGIGVGAHLHGVADVAGPFGLIDVETMHSAAGGNQLQTGHTALVERFTAIVEAARKDGDSVGGIVAFRAEGLGVGLGEPWADSVESHLAHLLFAIPAVKGVDFGAGFDAVAMRGSAHNDPWLPDADAIARPATNHAGGILGGLTSGAPLQGRVAIKPTSSIFQPQQSVDLTTGEAATLELKGRHDPLIAIRAVPVVEAAVAFALADLWLVHAAERAAAAAWPKGDDPR